MAFLLGFSVADLDIQQRTPSEERQFLFAACRYAGQAGSLDSVGINRREVVNERVIQEKE
jgi:hypothetical protein